MDVPSGVLDIIASYIIKPNMKSLDVININEIYGDVSKIYFTDIKYLYTLSYKSIYFASRYQ